MRTELTPAYVLHARAYRETRLLVEALTRDYGRVGLVARGARAARSRWRATLRPFLPVLLSWSGRGDLGTLTGAEADGPLRITGGAMLAGGLYLNELLMRLLGRSDPHPRLYRDYDRALADIGAPEPRAEPALRIFEKRLLGELGYALSLERDVAGQPIRAGTLYHYHLENGASPIDSAAQGNLVVNGATLLALADESISDADALAQAKRLNRAALAQYLGGRPLRSRELWRVART